MTTTGHTPTSNIQAMITGYEDLEEEEDEPVLSEPCKNSNFRFSAIKKQYK
jgi:thiosulfate reductase cytochrome b subunit